MKPPSTPEPADPGTDPAWQRQAAHVGAQHWPSATLYVVATPIGNLADLSLRALHALRQADVIAAEDTRTTRTLLDAWGISTPLMAAHRHNEAQAAQAVVERLEKGERVALVSDAGAPAVSDPGARMVRAVRQAGYRVVPIPGASAIVTALMASGVTSDENPSFAFAGFPPAKAAARLAWLKPWCGLPTPVVLYESPHRLATTLRDLLEICGAERELTIARELTKRFEEVVTLAIGEAATWLRAEPQRAQGEFVLIIQAAPAATQSDGLTADSDEVLRILLEQLSVRDAARMAARMTGAPRDALYSRALALRAADDDGRT